MHACSDMGLGQLYYSGTEELGQNYTGQVQVVHHRVMVQLYPA